MSKNRFRLRQCLPNDEDDISSRRVKYGANENSPKPAKMFMCLVGKLCMNVTLIVLLLCAALSLGLSFWKPTKPKEKKSMQGGLRERQFRALQVKIDHEHKLAVIRGGKQV
uniref:Cation-transporting P-type ATPase N-terminal domain-containing protein n=1 Tax=Ditylenchus dipsaci TaxID=166011 RepID=A0A915DSH3_9BILA